MISKDVVGKRIVRIEQWLHNPGEGMPAFWHVHYIELEDGTKIYADVKMQRDGYGIAMRAVKPPRKGGP